MRDVRGERRERKRQYKGNEANLVERNVLALGMVWKQGGDDELLSSTLAVSSSDERGVSIDKAALVEELVSGEGHGMAHAHRGREHLAADSEVRLLAQVLERVRLLRHGVVLAANLTGLVATIDGTKALG